MTQIATAHLLLRDFCADDRDAYRHLRSDKKFNRFYSDENAASATTDALLDQFIAQSSDVPRTKYQLAVLSPQGELMGSCGIRIESPQQASMGCEFGRRWQARGYAREAAAAMIAFGFTRLHVHRIFAETISENTAAIRLCQSLGMRIEAELVENVYFKNRWWNTVVLALLEREWRVAQDPEAISDRHM